jgi:hypothetical protein
VGLAEKEEMVVGLAKKEEMSLGLLERRWGYLGHPFCSPRVPFSRQQSSSPDFARFHLILRLDFAEFLIGFIVISDWIVEVVDCRFFFFFVDFVGSLLVQLIGV